MFVFKIVLRKADFIIKNSATLFGAHVIKVP